MSQLYKNATLEFLYPDGWRLDESQSEEGTTASLQSPYSMFVLVSCYDGKNKASELADQALQTMAEEYEELDSEVIRESIGSKPAVGHDVNFFSLDLTNTCWIRAFPAGDETVLIFAQTSDLDLERGALAFRAICASLKLGNAAAG